MERFGVKHLDLTDRNLLLQPIKKKYKYVLYPHKSAEKNYYLPMSAVHHFLVKVIDFEEPRKSRSSICDDFAASTTYLQKIHDKCPECKDKLAVVFDCLSSCKKDCLDDVFDIFTKPPTDVSSEEIIVPSMYHDFSIVDV